MTDYRFAPAAPDEEIVHGACSPGGIGRATPDDVDDWIEAMDDRGIERVCCLLSDGQLRQYHGLLDAYQVAFGADRVAHLPIRDHHLAEEERLREVLEFFQDADEAGEPVVAHCLAGIGRTGHALAAWLVHACGYEPEDAVETVRATGRQPDEAVRSGNATEEELYALLDSVRE